MRSLATIEKGILQLEKALKINNKTPDIRIKDYGFEILNTQGNVIKCYSPDKTPLRYHQDNSFVRCLLGPVNSGKSTASIAEILLRTCYMNPCLDNVRRAKWVVIRNTYSDLITTTLASFKMWLGDMGAVRLRQQPPIEYFTRFRDERGWVELEVHFLALDRPDDIRRLQSTEYTGAWINESRYINRVVLTTLPERVKRYPAKNFVKGERWGGIILDTNPPPTTSWHYELFEKTRPEEHIIFKQPPGLIPVNEQPTGHDRKVYGRDDRGQWWSVNPEAENLKHIEDGWYVLQLYGKSREQINVQILGQYGSYDPVNPVYSGYNDDLHSVESLEYIPDLPVGIGWDYGLTPACIFVQQDSKGRLLVIKELTSNDIGLEKFLTYQVMPYINQHLKGFQLISCGDPAGSQRAQGDEKTCQQILFQYGIPTTPASSNTLTKRIGAVQTFLSRLIDGKSGMVLSRIGCPTFRQGFIDKYILRIRPGTTGDIMDEPFKNEWSHIHDAFQYICMRYLQGVSTSSKKLETLVAGTGVLC